jgi:mannose-6-phosphate isomerase-like protein (cupin superfamily)
MEDETMNYLKFVPKRWGGERHIVNNEDFNYCGKILDIVAGLSLSYHYHMVKHETFFVQSGKGHMVLADTIEYTYPFDELECPNGNWWKIIQLKPGVTVTIPPFHPHKVFAHNDLRIIEFSTFDRSSDNYRLEKILENQ